MDLEHLVSRMDASARAIQALVAGASAVQWKWRPDSASWSLLEVINHLADEEVEDFRARLDSTLNRPGTSWPPTDPAGWVTGRKYNEQDPDRSVRRFMAARASSLVWLRSLGAPDWAVETMAPWGSIINAGDVTAAWVAHDLLHTRQLVELQWAYTTRIVVAPYKVAYAGEW